MIDPESTNAETPSDKRPTANPYFNRKWRDIVWWFFCWLCCCGSILLLPQIVGPKWSWLGGFFSCVFCGFGIRTVIRLAADYYAGFIYTDRVGLYRQKLPTACHSSISVAPVSTIWFSIYGGFVAQYCHWQITDSRIEFRVFSLFPIFRVLSIGDICIELGDLRQIREIGKNRFQVDHISPEIRSPIAVPRHVAEAIREAMSKHEGTN